MIIKTKFQFPGKSAFAFGGFVFVHPDKAHKKSLIAHEQTHLFQQERDGLFKFLYRYGFSNNWRACYEAEAYAVQLSYYSNQFNEKLDKYAKYLSTGYLLNMSQDQTKSLIMEFYNVQQARND